MSGQTPAFSNGPSRAASITDLDRVAYIPELEPVVDRESTPLASALNFVENVLPTSSDIERGTPPKSPLPARTRLETIRIRMKYYVPGTSWIPNYSVETLVGDIVAGATLASVLIPQSISYSTSLAKLPPLTGLFAAAVPGFVYPLLGSCPQLSVGPEASLALIVGQAMAHLIHGTPNKHPDDPVAVMIAASTMITFQVGVFTFLLGFVRLGFIDVILSRALLRGFVTAIGCIIGIEQLIPMFGLVQLENQYHLTTTLDKFIFLIKHLRDMHQATAIISISTFVILVIVRTIKRRLLKRLRWMYMLPEVFLAVVVTTILSGTFRWDELGVTVLGDVSLSKDATYFAFPLTPFNLTFFKRTTSTAILISVVGFLDSIVAAKQNSARFGYPVSLNRELVALGSTNLACSLVPGTLPAFGAITRSRLNADSGSRTPLASMVTGGLILLAIFFLLPLLHFLPKGVLGAIICLVVISLLNEAPEDIHFYWKLGAWSDLAMMTFTFLLTLLWNVEVGIGASLAVSLLLVIHRSSKARLSILGRIPGTDKWRPINEDPDAEEDVPGVLIVRIRENLDFANTTQLKERLRRLELYGAAKSHPSDEPSRPRASVLCFHMADVESIDASATQIFLELLQSSKDRGVGLYFTHLRDGPRRLFQKAGIMELLGEDSFQPNVAAAIAHINERNGGPSPGSRRNGSGRDEGRILDVEREFPNRFAT